MSEGKKALWNNLIPGGYTVTETAQPEWTTTVPPAPVTVPTNGGTAAASVTNTRKLGSLEVTKVVNWNGITPVESQILRDLHQGLRPTLWAANPGRARVQATTAAS